MWMSLKQQPQQTWQVNKQEQSLMYRIEININNKLLRSFIIADISDLKYLNSLL